MLNSKVGLFIDAENISHKDLPAIVEEVARYGHLSLKAAYADWSQPSMQHWREVAVAHEFKLRHQANEAKIKNATDMLLMMEAIEVLFRTPIDTFCIVTNDADYFPLCQKIREQKKRVFGIGYPHASDVFMRACDQFAFIGRVATSAKFLDDNLLLKTLQPSPLEVKPALSAPPPVLSLPSTVSSFPVPNSLEISPNSVQPVPMAQTPPPSSSAPVPSTPVIPQAKIDAKLKNLVTQAIQLGGTDEAGWITLGLLGSNLSKVSTNFKPNTYGHSTLTKLLEAHPEWIELRGVASAKAARLKKGK